MSELSIGSLVLLIALVVGIPIAATYGRRRGYFRSRSSQVGLFVVVGLIAALVWLGPAAFMVAES